jgi:hypothetical protein
VFDLSAGPVAGGTAVRLLVRWAWSPGRVFEGWATAATFAGLVIAATVALRVRVPAERARIYDVRGDLNSGIWTSRRIPPRRIKPGQDTSSDLRLVDWWCLIPASFVQFADILLTNC